KLARALGIDPVELRLRNALAPGSVLPTGQVIRGSAPVREVIRRCAAIPLPPEEPPQGRHPIFLPGGTGNVSRGERLRRGVGFAVGYKNIAYSGGFDDSAEARVRLFRGPGGAVAEVHSAAAEVGQGIHTILLQVARTELGIEQVVLHPPDTQVGSAGSTSASRQTVMSGGAVQLACRAVKEELLARVRRLAQTEGRPLREPLDIEGGMVLAAGDPLAPVEEFLEPPIEQTRVYHHRRTTPIDARGHGEPHVAFGFAAERAVVEVDEELGLVRVVQIAGAQDVGRALHPQGVTGQIEGGTAQGLGFALMEELQLEEGRIRNASFTDYLIPTVLDMPPVVSALVEDPDPDAPYGAKGVGEMSAIVSTPAILAALRDATGRELNRVPVRPDDLIGLAPPRTSAGPPPSPQVPGPEPIPYYAGLAAGQATLMRGPG
ncbi:MAG: xanthine dehydrogenase subunit D, partial [Armatimonadota bacterium]|nr:xanthine dehydrogenase subunit D [Armatimonadota bacterium]